MLATVINNSEHKNTVKLTFRFSDILLNKPNPGQFVMMKLMDENDVIISRRSFSIHSYNEKSNEIEIVFKVVGDETFKYSRLRSGDVVDAICPLGNGFNLSLLNQESMIFFVTSGMGIAPFKFLYDIMRTNIKPAMIPRVLMGFRSEWDVVYENDFDLVHVTIDIGTLNQKYLLGNVVDAFKSIVINDKRYRLPVNKDRIAIFGCGPIDMLYNLADLCIQHGLRFQLSFESEMDCSIGIGICQGCTVKIPWADVNREDVNSLFKVCEEGPIYIGPY